MQVYVKSCITYIITCENEDSFIKAILNCCFLLFIKGLSRLSMIFYGNNFIIILLVLTKYTTLNYWIIIKGFKNDIVIQHFFLMKQFKIIVLKIAAAIHFLFK